MTSVSLFSGARGTCTGLGMLGVTGLIGVEVNRAACETSRANGHAAIQADVTKLRPYDVCSYGDAEGLTASPVCRGVTVQGDRLGFGDLWAIKRAIQLMGTDGPQDRILAQLREDCVDKWSHLMAEPLRWALFLEPEWVLFEQVPGAAPIWEATADVLRDQGYSVWTGKVYAEQHRVPATRVRSVLVGSRSADVGAPIPTHSRYHSSAPDRLDPGLPRPITMAEALGWGMTHRPSMTVTGGGTKAGGPEVFGNAARKGMQRERDAGRWIDIPGQTRIGNISLADCARLQTFPEGYEWRGTKTEQHQQVGDAVPPLLAAHLGVALGLGQIPQERAA